MFAKMRNPRSETDSDNFDRVIPLLQTNYCRLFRVSTAFQSLQLKISEILNMMHSFSTIKFIISVIPYMVFEMQI